MSGRALPAPTPFPFVSTQCPLCSVCLRSSGLRRGHITWVLRSQPLGPMAPAMPGPLCRAGCPTESVHLLEQLKSTFLCVPPRVPGPRALHSTLRASATLSLGKFKPGTIRCKPTPSLNRNREVFKTINKPLPFAEDQLLTF